MPEFSNDFGKNLGKYAMMKGQKVERTIRAFTLEILKGVVMDTPVDTGRLKGNWQVSSGTPIFTEIDRTDQTKKGSMGAEAAKEMANNINPLGVTYMTNNLPYAKVINDEGGKGGVNAGFVEKNMARVERNMREAVAHVKG